MRVRAGEKVIDDVRTVVRDGTLRVDFDHDGWGGDNVIVEASVPRLEGVEASGSGDIDADGIGADAFKVRSDGSSDISLRGTAGPAGRSTSTAPGDADLGELEADAARVNVGGSGDADVRADKTARRQRGRLGRRALPRQPGADAGPRRLGGSHARATSG